MPTFVSIAGAGSGSLQVPFDGTANLAIAQQLATAINLAKQVPTNNFAVYTTSAPAPTLAAYNQLQLDATSNVSSVITVPTGYNTLVDNAAAATVTGSANLNVIGGIGRLLFTNNAAGTETITLGGGFNIINLGTAINALVATGDGLNNISVGGNGTILGGSGGTNIFFGSSVAGDSSQILSQGANDTVVAGAGNAAVSVRGTNAVVYGNSGTLTVTDQGLNDTVVAGTGNNTITSSASGGVYALNGQSVITANIGPDTIYAGTGVSTIFSNSASDVVFGGSGGFEFVGQGNVSTIQAATGSVSVFGSSGSNITFTGSGAGGASIKAGGGSETINASGTSKSLYASGGGGLAQITGGSGNDTIYTGTGNNTLTGGGGTNLFVAANGSSGGNDLITDFNTGDYVFLLGYGSSPQVITNALATATVSGGSTTITLADATKITFAGVSSLSAANFRNF